MSFLTTPRAAKRPSHPPTGTAMHPTDRIRARLDAQAAPQLRAEIERLRLALEESQAALAAAQREIRFLESAADAWRDDALAAFDLAGTRPGITQAGRLVAA